MKTIRYRKIQSGIYQCIGEFSIQTAIRLTEWASCPYVMLTASGRLILSHGYISDGPSGPTLDSKSSIRGAFIHDALYRLMRRGELDQSYRKYADELIRDCCIEDGMNKFRAGYWYHSLRLFGGKSSKYDAKDGVVLTAP